MKTTYISHLYTVLTSHHNFDIKLLENKPYSHSWEETKTATQYISREKLLKEYDNAIVRLQTSGLRAPCNIRNRTGCSGSEPVLYVTLQTMTKTDSILFGTLDERSKAQIH